MAQGKVFSTGLEQLFDDDDLVCTHRKPVVQKPVKQVCDTGLGAHRPVNHVHILMRTCTMYIHVLDNNYWI